MSINQAILETVGSCSFAATSDPTNTVGFSYRVSFSKVINPSSFTVADITNAGLGGLTNLTWTITNCGDNTNFKLTAAAITGDGTIIPTIAANAIQDFAGNNNLTSTATDNIVTFDSIQPSVSINQAILETVGSCSFAATSDPTNAVGFSYRVAFSKIINPTSFTIADIVNTGTGGGTTLTWTLTNCGDNTNFKLTAAAITGNGTIIPGIAANTVQDFTGNNNLLSTATDNTVTYDTVVPTVTINQAILETVGSCSFTAVSDPTGTVGFSYRVAFSEAINTTSFTTADIINAGTGGATTLTWTLTNCGDNTNFKLTATAITGDGTIIPTIAANTVQDPAGNNNLASTATDNSVTFDATPPAVTINQAILETVGSCSFSNTIDPTNSAGFSYRITFSKTINPSSFTIADLINSGTGGATTLTWALTNCGDNTNFKLTVSAINGDGNIVPTLAANLVQDLAGNNNLASTATDNSVTYFVPSWYQEAYIKAANSDASDYFGGSVSLDGDTLAVAAYAEDSGQNTITNGTTASVDNVYSNSGAVYVYKRTGSTWAQEAYVKAANSGSSDQFGTSVSLSGNTLAVGAFAEASNQTTITNGLTASADNSNVSSGAVYVYKRTGNSWAQEAYVKAVNNGANDYFGSSISLSGDTLAVGAYGEDSNQITITSGTSASADNSNASSGAVYVYKRIGSLWSQEAYVKAVNNGANDYFGWNVSLSGDTLTVAANQEASNQTTITNGATASANNANPYSGAVYVYRNSARLFAPSNLLVTSSTTTSLAFSWMGSGALATGYKIAYQIGATPPADCTLGTVVNVGNVLSYNLTGLSVNTTYSFRICAYDVGCRNFQAA